MPPVSIERFLKELEKLKGDMDAGKLKSGGYDQRLARVIQELRERGVDADRARITAALVDAHQRASSPTPSRRTSRSAWDSSEPPGRHPGRRAAGLRCPLGACLVGPCFILEPTRHDGGPMARTLLSVAAVIALLACGGDAKKHASHART